MGSSNASPSPTIGTAIALGLIAHQIFRKYETYNVSVHAALLFFPPIFLALFVAPPPWTLLHSLLVSTPTFLATLVLSVLIYRLSPLHPLAQYPGPFGCKVTKAWMAYLCIPGYQHLFIKSLHDQYGDIVRIGPNELSIRNASLLHALLGPAGAPKGPHFVGVVLSAHRLPLAGIMDTEEHLRRRRKWGRGMRPAALKDHEHFIVRRARQLVNRLEDSVGKEVDIGDWFNFFSYDFMNDMAFGGGTELIKAGHDEGNVWALMEEAMFMSTIIGHVPWLGVYFGNIPAATGKLMVLLNYCADCVKSRLKRGSQRRDLFHYLNNEDLPDKDAPPMEQLVDDGIQAIVAGADTTSSALTSLMYLLLTHPESYEKLQAEIDKFYPVGENALDPKYYREMTYLSAVINEALRVLPPVPGGTQRQVDKDGLVAGNIVLPPGTIFWPHIFSHHHDPRSFAPYTSDFWPERWLLASGDLETSRGITASSPDFVHSEAGFLPFSMGPMNCVGKALALQELRMVMCSFLQKYKVQMKAGWDPKLYTEGYRDYFTSSRPDLPVVLTARY